MAESGPELRQMRLDAIRRAREMQQRARIGTRPPPPPPPPPEMPPPPPPPEPAQAAESARPPRTGPGTRPGGPGLGIGRDQALILAVILLLAGERRNDELLLALLYVLL